ncbi:MAG: DUF1648 domain-containing protein [Gordonia sp. (in: high G+C Gram-positive bacteria)]|uniref:DUF1648 domain-containing protein n=1 Tax=Gordonia sp. (in: high G+C Gram-positive bacteria) TaxID=84139 RepID=UPI003C78B27F
MGETVRRVSGPLVALLAGVVGGVLLALWSGDLPDPVASHFRADGTADGFSSVTSLLVMTAVTAVIGAVIAGIGAFRLSDPTTARIVTGLGAGTAVFVIAVEVAITSRQRGLSDAAAATAPVWIIVGAGVLAVIIGGGVGLLTPVRAVDYADLPRAGRTPVDAAGRREWHGRASMGVGGLLTVGASVAVLVGLGVVMSNWIMIGIAVVVALVGVGLTGSVQVSVSEQGFHAGSRLGWPKIEVPLAEIRRAEVVDVHALRDFGGWGYRVSGRRNLRGAKGFVLRSGPALLVVAADRREVVVVDGAEDAAAILNALVSR